MVFKKRIGQDKFFKDCWPFLAVCPPAHKAVLLPDSLRIIVIDGFFSTQNAQVCIEEVLGDITVQHLRVFIHWFILHFVSDSVKDDSFNDLGILCGQLSAPSKVSEQDLALDLVVSLLWIIDGVVEPESQVEQETEPVHIRFE